MTEAAVAWFVFIGIAIAFCLVAGRIERRGRRG